MTTKSLENRLREKIVTDPPRPGFETRVQAMARERFAPERKLFIHRYAIPVMAIIAIFVIIAPKEKPSTPTLAKTPEAIKPSTDTILETTEETGVQREIRGLKNDAHRAISLFKKALPSIPVRKKNNKEKL